MNLFDACPKIYFGKNAIDCLFQVSVKKAVLITDPFMISSEMVHVVTSRLKKRGTEYVIFSEIEPDPSIETVISGLQKIFEEKPDAIIALGGGSAIDAAKAMIYFCVRIKGVLISEQYIHQPLFIAIPTTSGTGSEVTSYAVISDKEKGVKIPLNHHSMIPDIAILDSDFTKTLPAPMIAYTGMDVLTHAVEAFVSRQANDFTNMLAREAASITLCSLPVLFQNSSNEKMREKMYNASTMAGLAFTNARLGLCHGIAHTIGAQFHLPHGEANAIVLPYIILFNSGLNNPGRHGVLKQYAKLAGSIGLGSGSDIELCQRLIVTMKVLCEQFHIPTSLSAYGIEKHKFLECIELCADKILEDSCTQANPVAVTKEDVLSLLNDIYFGRLEIKV